MSEGSKSLHKSKVNKTSYSISAAIPNCFNLWLDNLQHLTKSHLHGQ